MFHVNRIGCAQAIAPYKNRDPNSIDEEECLENLFNSLCACLMSSDTRDLFLKAEGASFQGHFVSFCSALFDTATQQQLKRLTD